MINRRAFCSRRAVQRVMMTLMTLSWASWRAIKLLHFHFNTSPYIHKKIFSRFANRTAAVVSKDSLWSLQACHPKERPCRYYLTDARQLLYLKIASVLQTLRHPLYRRRPLWRKKLTAWMSLSCGWVLSCRIEPVRAFSAGRETGVSATTGW